MKISTPAVEDSAPGVAHPVEQNDAPDSAANDADLSDCPHPDLPGCGKSAGRPRAADKEARLQNLLDTAAHLFLEKGYGKVSLEMIARSPCGRAHHLRQVRRQGRTAERRN